MSLLLLLNISFPTFYWSEELKKIKHEVLNVRNGLDMRPHRYGVKTSGLKASHQASKTCVKVHVDRQSLSHGYTLPGVQLLIPTARCVSIPGPSPHAVHALVPSPGNALPGRDILSIDMRAKVSSWRKRRGYQVTHIAMPSVLQLHSCEALLKAEWVWTRSFTRA